MQILWMIHVRENLALSGLASHSLEFCRFSGTDTGPGNLSLIRHQELFFDIYPKMAL